VSLVNEHALVLITGISASGKSTVGQLLAERFARGVHVPGDIFRRMIVSGRADMTDDLSDEALSQLRLRYRLSALTADNYFEAGYSVVVQDVVLGAALTEYVGLLTGRPLYVVVLCPRVGVVEAREAARSKTAYARGNASLQGLDQALRHETPRIGLWLDSSDHEPEQTVDAIAARAADARV
jgi:chloramphenicol 3-O-phosphotransferase